jgi:coenzyme PQQ synthesis protein D (PqqD)
MTVDHDEQDRLVWRVLEDEAIILDLSTGYYFSLNSVATEIWTHLHEGRATSDIVTAIAGKYRIDVETVRRDVDELLDDLRAAALWE